MGGVLWKILDSNLFIYFDPIDESKGSKKILTWMAWIPVDSRHGFTLHGT
jgi:hypothetical protein